MLNGVGIFVGSNYNLQLKIKLGVNRCKGSRSILVSGYLLQPAETLSQPIDGFQTFNPEAYRFCPFDFGGVHWK